MNRSEPKRGAVACGNGEVGGGDAGDAGDTAFETVDGGAARARAGCRDDENGTTRASGARRRLRRRIYSIVKSARAAARGNTYVSGNPKVPDDLRHPPSVGE
jgi:hypothetical protein